MIAVRRTINILRIALLSRKWCTILKQNKMPLQLFSTSDTRLTNQFKYYFSNESNDETTYKQYCDKIDINSIDFMKTVELFNVFKAKPQRHMIDSFIQQICSMNSKYQKTSLNLIKTEDLTHFHAWFYDNLQKKLKDQTYMLMIKSPIWPLFPTNTLQYICKIVIQHGVQDNKAKYSPKLAFALLNFISDQIKRQVINDLKMDKIHDYMLNEVEKEPNVFFENVRIFADSGSFIFNILKKIIDPSKIEYKTLTDQNKLMLCLVNPSIVNQFKIDITQSQTNLSLFIKSILIVLQKDNKEMIEKIKNKLIQNNALYLGLLEQSSNFPLKCLHLFINHYGDIVNLEKYTDAIDLMRVCRNPQVFAHKFKFEQLSLTDQNEFLERILKSCQQNSKIITQIFINNFLEIAKIIFDIPNLKAQKKSINAIKIFHCFMEIRKHRLLVYNSHFQDYNILNRIISYNARINSNSFEEKCFQHLSKQLLYSYFSIRQRQYIYKMSINVSKLLKNENTIKDPAFQAYLLQFMIDFGQLDHQNIKILDKTQSYLAPVDKNLLYLYFGKKVSLLKGRTFYENIVLILANFDVFSLYQRYLYLHFDKQLQKMSIYQIQKIIVNSDLVKIPNAQHYVLKLLEVYVSKIKFQPKLTLNLVGILKKLSKKESNQIKKYDEQLLKIVINSASSKNLIDSQFSEQKADLYMKIVEFMQFQQRRPNQKQQKIIRDCQVMLFNNDNIDKDAKFNFYINLMRLDIPLNQKYLGSLFQQQMMNTKQNKYQQMIMLVLSNEDYLSRSFRQHWLQIFIEKHLQKQLGFIQVMREYIFRMYPTIHFKNINDENFTKITILLNQLYIKVCHLLQKELEHKYSVKIQVKIVSRQFKISYYKVTSLLYPQRAPHRFIALKKTVPKNYRNMYKRIIRKLANRRHLKIAYFDYQMSKIVNQQQLFESFKTSETDQ